MKRIFVLVLIVAVMQVGCFNENDPNTHKVYFGLTHQESLDGETLTDFRKTFKFKPHIIGWTVDWEEPFPAKTLQAILSRDALPFISWEPWVWQDIESITLKSINAGSWDKHITKWAKEAKLFQYPIFMALAPEFNIEKYPWSIKNQNQSPESYKKAYQKIVDIFKKEDAINVIWVWGPGVTYKETMDWASIKKAYPGGDYIDWVGVSVLVDEAKTPSMSFIEAVEPSITKLEELIPTKPIMITKIGYSAKFKKKATWITKIPESLTKIKKVKAILWLNEKIKTKDWLIHTSDVATQKKVKEMVNNPIFKADLEKLNTIHLLGSEKER
jgi:beta-mannanase